MIQLSMLIQCSGVLGSIGFSGCEPMAGQNLSRLLLKLFAKGELAGTQVFELASAAWLDGWGREDELARKLVRAGDGGRARSHIAADIIKAAESMGLVCSSALPYQVNLSTGGHVLMFLPHEFFPAMTAEFGHEQVCLSQEALNSEQGLAQLLKQWARHPDVDYAGDLAQVGVLGLHCDGVQYTSSTRAGGARSILVGSMNIISSDDTIRHKRQPVFVLRKPRL